MRGHMNQDETSCENKNFKRMITTIPKLVMGPLEEKQLQWDTEKENLIKDKEKELNEYIKNDLVNRILQYNKLSKNKPEITREKLNEKTEEQLRKIIDTEISKNMTAMQDKLFENHTELSKHKREKEQLLSQNKDIFKKWSEINEHLEENKQDIINKLLQYNKLSKIKSDITREKLNEKNTKQLQTMLDTVISKSMTLMQDKISQNNMELSKYKQNEQLVSQGKDRFKKWSELNNDFEQNKKWNEEKNNLQTKYDILEQKLKPLVKKDFSQISNVSPFANNHPRYVNEKECLMYSNLINSSVYTKQSWDTRLKGCSIDTKANKVYFNTHETGDLFQKPFEKYNKKITFRS